MPDVTLEHIYPATYVSAPTSALTPNLPSFVGARGILGVLKVVYGPASGIDTRWICVFMGADASFHTNPGSVGRQKDLLSHTRHTEPSEVLRHPQQDDLTGTYVNQWRITAPEICDPQQKEDFLCAMHARWRVLRRARLT